MSEHARRNAGYTAVAALLMLLYGWHRAGIVAVESAGPFYQATVQCFNWMLVGGGIALGIAAALCYVGLRYGLLLDAAVSAMCGLSMTLCGVYWLKDGLDLQFALLAVFGVFFMRAALNSWSSYSRDASDFGHGELPGEAASEPAMSGPAEPAHPASVRSSSLPKEGEPPPPDGYLAALSKEDEEPPPASRE